ncbi:MAG: T9SS type A sorting domain-containing protein [Bacteroidota bacterium]
MKKTFTLLTALLMSSVLAFGQDILDVPPWDDTDPAILPLIDVIAGDTTDTGDRVSEDRVYRLERDGIYMITSTLFADYSFSLIATDGDGRPPLLISAKTAEGAVVLPFMKFLSNDEEYAFENIMFQAINTDLQQTIWTSALQFSGNNTRVTFDGCVLNGWTGRSTDFYGANNSVFFRDVIWRNVTHTDHPFVGQQIAFGPLDQDTLVIHNCTQFNANGYWLYHRSAMFDYVVIEHNTFYVTMTTLFALEHSVNLIFRSNLLYGVYALGDHPISRRDKWYTTDGLPLAHILVDAMADTVLAAGGLTEADRSILLTNNAWHTPQAIQDHYDANDTLTGPVWMNDRVQGMFDDDASYPLFVAENNVEIDPVFADADMDTWMTTETANAATEFMNHPPGAFWGTTSTMRNYDSRTGIDQDLLIVPWPLAEGNLEITEASLLTAGHDGLPVGNLNWDPTLRAQYRLPGEPGVGIENQLQNSMGFSITQNYPNPFSHETMIGYSLSNAADVTISVYNVLSQKVATLVNEYRDAGEYSVRWDAADMPAGIYTYRIEADGLAQTRKMMLVK